MLKGVQSSGLMSLDTIEEGFAMMREAGFEAVDFNFDNLYTYNEIVNLKPADHLKPEYLIPFMNRVRDAARENNIVITQCHAPYPSYIHGNPEENAIILDAIIKAIEFCGFCNCRRLIVHPAFVGTPGEFLSKQEEHRINIELYTALIPHLRKHKVICCLENMFGWDDRNHKVYVSICGDPHEVNAYIDELNEIAGEKLFGFCIDTGHLMLLGHDQYNFITEVGSRIEAFHVHDNDGVYDKHVCPYLGIINWERFCAAVREIGYKNDLCLEACTTFFLFKMQMKPVIANLLSKTCGLLIDKINGGQQ